MQKKLKRIALDTNIFLKSFIKQQKKTDLIFPMQYGIFPGGKKIRSKILVDLGQLFNINYKTLIRIVKCNPWFNTGGCDPIKKKKIKHGY